MAEFRAPVCQTIGGLAVHGGRSGGGWALEYGGACMGVAERGVGGVFRVGTRAERTTARLCAF